MKLTVKGVRATGTFLAKISGKVELLAWKQKNVQFNKSIQMSFKVG
jgi:hypothetical protein